MPAPEVRKLLASRWDEYRRWLMWEPWGHQDLAGALVLEAGDEDVAATVVFLDALGYPLIDPAAALAAAGWLVSTNRVQADRPGTVWVTLDTPGGHVPARVEWDGNRVASSAVAVPVSVTDEPRSVDVEGHTLRATLVRAGAALVVVDALSLGLSGLVTEADRARDVGKKVLEALHLPVQDDSRVVLTTGKTPEGAWRQIVVSSDGQVDRSPGGAAVAARVALMTRDGLQPGVRVRFEGILGTGLEGWWEEEAGPGGAPRTVWVAGVPWITGYRRFFRDPDDAVMPFLVR
jgi:proline racemase